MEIHFMLQISNIIDLKNRFVLRHKSRLLMARRGV